MDGVGGGVRRVQSVKEQGMSAGCGAVIKAAAAWLHNRPNDATQNVGSVILGQMLIAYFHLTQQTPAVEGNPFQPIAMVNVGVQEA